MANAQCQNCKDILEKYFEENLRLKSDLKDLQIQWLIQKGYWGDLKGKLDKKINDDFYKPTMSMIERETLKAVLFEMIKIETAK